MFGVARRNSLLVTWVMRCLQGNPGGCFQWSLLRVGVSVSREYTFESQTRRNLWLVWCGVLFTLSFQTGRCGAPVLQKLPFVLFQVNTLCGRFPVCVRVALKKSWCVITAVFLLNVASCPAKNVRKIN